MIAIRNEQALNVVGAKKFDVYTYRIHTQNGCSNEKHTVSFETMRKALNDAIREYGYIRCDMTKYKKVLGVTLWPEGAYTRLPSTICTV
jgi:hypothetical protein